MPHPPGAPVVAQRSPPAPAPPAPPSNLSFLLALGAAIAWCGGLLAVSYVMSQTQPGQDKGGRDPIPIALTASFATVALALPFPALAWCTRADRCTIVMCFVYVLGCVGAYTPLAMGAQLSWFEATTPICLLSSASNVTTLAFAPRDAAHIRYALPARSAVLWPAYRFSHLHTSVKGASYTVEMMPLLSPLFAANLSAVLAAALGDSSNTKPDAMQGKDEEMWSPDDWGAGALIWVQNYQALSGWNDSMELEPGAVYLPDPQHLFRIGDASPIHGMS